MGIRYYSGYATNGESVTLTREPTNQYDSNAIKVSNCFDAQIGHIPKTVAAKLTPFMDRRQLAVEAFLAGEKGAFDVPIRIILYGPGEPAARQALEAKMRSNRLPLSTKTRMNQELGLRQPVASPSPTPRRYENFHLEEHSQSA